MAPLVPDYAPPADECLGGKRLEAEEGEVLGEGFRVSPPLLHLAEAVGGDALQPSAPVDEHHVGRPPGLVPEQILHLPAMPSTRIHVRLLAITNENSKSIYKVSHLVVTVLQGQERTYCIGQIAEKCRKSLSPKHT